MWTRSCSTDLCDALEAGRGKFRIEGQADGRLDALYTFLRLETTFSSMFVFLTCALLRKWDPRAVSRVRFLRDGWLRVRQPMTASADRRAPPDLTTAMSKPETGKTDDELARELEEFRYDLASLGPST
jgi:hypothetical protein